MKLSTWLLTALLLASTGCATVSPAQTGSLAEHGAFTVKVTGHGPPVILIPGLISSGAVWDETVKHLEAHHTCHVLTLAGFAGVPEIDGPFLPTMEHAIEQYIADQHLDHPIIIGHSLGGVLALDLAAKAPDRVGRLVIVDSLPFLSAAFDPSATAESTREQAAKLRDQLQNAPPEMRRAFERRSIRTLVTDPAKQELALEWAMRSSRYAAAEAFYELSTTDLRPVLSKIRSRALILASTMGDASAEAHQRVAQVFEQQYASLADKRIAVIDGSRHFLMWDAQDRFFAELDGFLGGAKLVTSR